MKTINLGEPLEPITIPPVDLERNPWSASGDPRKIDAKKIKDLEVETITMSDDGYFRSGKLAFNDTSNAGWYQSSKGIYMGTAGDTKSLKYDVLAGTIVFKGVDLSWSDITGEGKPENYATVGATWNSNISGQPSNSSILNPSYITSTKITSTTIESPTITAGTITGATIQTNVATYPYVKINSSGVTVSGTSVLNFITSSGVGCGYIGGDSSNGLEMSNSNGKAYIYGRYGVEILSNASNSTYITTSTLNINAIGAFGDGNVKITGDVVSTSNGGYNLGSSDKLWSNVYAYNLSLDGGKYINYTGGFIQANSQFRVVGSINLTGNLTFENNASITIGGRAYYQTTGAYDSSKYYLRSY